MKRIFLASAALGAMILPTAAQALSVTIAWDSSQSAGSAWSEQVQAGLALSLDGDETIEILDAIAYDGADDFAQALSATEADVVITDFAEAGDHSTDPGLATEASPLFVNLKPGVANTCTGKTIHLAGDVALGRLAAIYMNGVSAQRTFAFVKDNDEGKQRLADFRGAFTGGLGGAAFAEPAQDDFENEIAILRVTKADGAYFDLEGDPLYAYLDAVAAGSVVDSITAVTTSNIDYDMVSEATRGALAAMTLVSAWNPDTVEAQDFATAYSAAAGEDPGFAGLLGYEAGDVLQRALEGEADSLFSNILALTWQSPRGPMSFDPHGYAVVPVGAYKFTEEALSLKGRIAVPAEHSCTNI